MNRDAIDQFLQDSLADCHLSRSERKDMSQVLAELGNQPSNWRLFRNRAFELTRQAMKDSRDVAVVNWLEDILNSLEGRSKLPKSSHSKAYFSPGTQCRSKIIELLQRSTRQVDICVFTVTDNHICNAIQAIHQRGVKIRVVTDNDKSSDHGSDIARLANLGIAVKIDETNYHMHHKFALFDETQLLTGSYNWTRTAANENNENFVVMNEPRTVRAFADEFERLWKSLPFFPV